MQTALARVWGAIPNEDNVQNLAKKIEVVSLLVHPEHSVIAAEKCFLWVMDVLRSENGPLDTVEDCLEKSIRNEGQFIGIC